MFSSSPEPTNDDSSRLDTLQRESWQLELIITGFTLAGMISGVGQFLEITEYGRDILFEYGLMGKVVRSIVSGVQMAYFVVLLHFFLNVVVRCLWIGALGMRHVIGTEGYLKNLAYEPVFLDFLRKRNGNFDRYVNRLDDAASLIFAITFFLVAILIGVMLFVALSFGFISLMTDLLGQDTFIVVFVALIFALGPLILLYIIDFASGGVMKGTGKWYFYLYRFMGWLSFARLYRPLYYLIISKAWGRNLVWLTIPYAVVFLTFPLFNLNPVSYFNRGDFANSTKVEQALHDRNYANADGFVLSKARVYLANDVVVDRVLKVHVPLYERYLEGLEKLCPQFADNVDQIPFGRKDNRRSERSPWRAINPTDTLRLEPHEDEGTLDTTMLECILSVLELDLDGREVKLDEVLLSAGKRGAPFPELIAYFSLRDKEPGLHRVKLQEWRSFQAKPDSLYVCCTQIVPFYFAPED
ncbi:MAG: hypothetical protein AAGA62_06010 [Bacteroidota bacterium]